MVTLRPRAIVHLDAAHYAERDALDTLSELESPRSLWRPSGEHIDDITHACAMTARARVEQVRALVALLTWGLS